MADENKKDIISVLEQRKDDAVGMGDVSTAKAIQLKIDYLNSLEDPEDVARIAKNSPEFKQFVSDVTRGGDLEKDANAALQVAPPKRPERDEKTAKKTITLEELAKIAPSTDGIEEILDENSDYYYHKWTPEQLTAYAKKAGMARGDFLKKIDELKVQKDRKAIANEGVLGSAMSIFTPRIQKDIENGENPGFFSIALDLAENAAQAVPVGRVVGSAGKVGKAYNALEGTAANIGKKVAENAVVPSLFAYVDAARDGDVTEGASKAVNGTAVNLATPRNLYRAANVAKSYFGGEKVAKKALKSPGVLQEIVESYLMNKAGKKQYGDAAVNMFLAKDPTGEVVKAVENLPGSAADKAQKKRKKQIELEKKHTEDVVKDYKNFSKLSDYITEE